jgi:hypothetical protein
MPVIQYHIQPGLIFCTDYYVNLNYLAELFPDIYSRSGTLPAGFVAVHAQDFTIRKAVAAIRRVMVSLPAAYLFRAPSAPDQRFAAGSAEMPVVPPVALALFIGPFPGFSDYIFRKCHITPLFTVIKKRQCLRTPL